MLKVINHMGEEELINDNKDKAKIFAKLFFPPPPTIPDDPRSYVYPELLPDPPVSMPNRFEDTSRSSCPTRPMDWMAFCT